MIQDNARLLQGERMLSVRETAKIMGWCLDSVRRHLRAGDMPGVQVGRNWRIPESQLAVYMGLRNRVGAGYTSSPALPKIQTKETPEDGVTTETLDASSENQSEIVSVLLQTQAARARVRDLVWSALYNTDASYETTQQTLAKLDLLMSQ